MQTRGASGICKGEMQIIGAKARCTWQMPMRHAKVMGAANERCWSIVFLWFGHRNHQNYDLSLVWTWKPSKLRPKSSQESHESATGRPKRPKWSPKGCQEGPQSAKVAPKDPLREPKERPKASQIDLRTHFGTSEKIKSENAINPWGNHSSRAKDTINTWESCMSENEFFRSNIPLDSLPDQFGGVRPRPGRARTTIPYNYCDYRA